MDNIKKLEKLIKDDVLIEIEENINELQNELARKKNKAFQEELKYMKEVKKYFDEVITDIKSGSLTQEQAIDILEGLEDMKIENQEI